MEQSATSETQILETTEELITDIDVRATHVAEIVANQNVNTAVITEDTQDLPNVCKLPLEPASSADNDTNVETEGAKSDDRVAVGINDILTKEDDAGDHRTGYKSGKLCAETYVSTEEESIEIYEHIKDELNDATEELEPTFSSEEDQSLNVITESNVVEAEEKVTDIPESVVDIEDESRPDAADKQCHPTVDNNSLDEHSKGRIYDARDSVEETIKEIHGNGDKQDSSVAINSELAKLHEVGEGETEVVVVLEAIPVATDATADNFIVTVDGKSDDKENDRETTVAFRTLQEKKTVESGNEINEFHNLIDYSQENDGTVIEVISTEVVHAPIAEQHHQQQSDKNCIESDKYDVVEPVKLADGEVAIKKSVDDKSNESKAIDGKSLDGSINKEDNATEEGTTIIIDEKIIITEDVDSDAADSPQTESVHENAIDTAVVQQDETATADSIKKRSVIQDIFDDWGVENADEDVQSTSKIHDSVEIELKSLLDETKTDQIVTNKSEAALTGEKIPPLSKECATDDTRNIANVIDRNTTKQLTEQTESQERSKAVSQDVTSLSKNGRESISVGKVSRAFNTVSQPQTTITTTTTVSKNRSRHLTSQIASPAEVTEVLKERFREKQRIVVDAPRGPDIFFVKKLTQRLSSKLAGGSVNPTSQPVPLPQQSVPSPPAASTQLTVDNCDKRAGNTETETTNKDDNNSDNKELLAILEGDVDPDWSILKPPTLMEESKAPSNVEPDQSGPPKLDPLVEREMALKQLLELPVTPSKKAPSPRKKKTFKPAPSKASKDTDTKSPVVAQEPKIDSDVNLASESSVESHAELIEVDLSFSPNEQHGNRKEQNVEQALDRGNSRMEESRSGRKRKLTEKAREHEQNTIKRQKVFKGKVSMSKKQVSETDSSPDVHSTPENRAVRNDSPVEIHIVNTEKTVAKEVANKFEDKVDSTLSKADITPLKRSKQNLSKRGPITKRKVVVKKLLRQKMSPTKKPVKLKTKLGPSPKKSTPKVIAKSQKRTSEGTSGDAKPKKKIINEIDRLLQDEGVVNLLYDVEQPDKKRLVPITKSRAKVMDLQKVQRELKIRKKLVRNAVLRLRTSTAGVTKVSPRSKRTSVYPSDVQTDRKMVEQVASLKTPNATSPTEFILPAKIRNAADASIIIRRHSSSSFSSASGSPRVSVDSQEKPAAEIAKLDDGTIHSLRSAKRRHSQDDKINNAKKSKKRAVEKSDVDATAINTSTNITTITSTSTTTTTTTTATATTNLTNAAANNAEEKVISSTRPSKRSEIKKIDKVGKQQDSTLESITSSKVTTRSNGAAMGKVTAKSKRSMKSKVTFVRTSDGNENVEDSSKEEDELSACLAEAATALSIFGANSRSGNTSTTRKGKGKVNTSMLDLGSTKTETQGQFRNKEINVRRHGNLVQLILTPSSLTRIRNALTLQVMQEFIEALSILRRDDKCRVVLLTSTGTSFCEGLELSTLLCANKEERRSVAQELAHAVKDFIKSLATFNKPIVAGVQGAAVGLGVTMLSLFDLVIASDKATFCTPYGKLGQIAEGAAVFTLSHILGSAVASELLLSGRTLTANEALRAGLVTRVLWPDRFEVDLLPSLRAMSDQSSQSMEATKTLLRHSLRKKLDAALESETYILIKHWCSTECQTAIKAYIDGKM